MSGRTFDELVRQYELTKPIPARNRKMSSVARILYAVNAVVLPLAYWCLS
jgi:hypothetical protein